MRIGRVVSSKLTPSQVLEMRRGKVKKKRELQHQQEAHDRVRQNPVGKLRSGCARLPLTSYPVLCSCVMPIQRAIGCVQACNQPIVPDIANRDRNDGRQLFLRREILRGRHLS